MTSRSGLIDYADAGALEVSAGVDPAELGPALDAILAELARLRDELVPDAELAKAKRYLAGGMELRMDDTRHVASWIGGQEALHDRVLDLDDALAAVASVDAEAIQRVAATSSTTRGSASRPSPRPATCAASSRTCGCPGDRRHDRARERPATRSAGRASLALARLHLRVGSFALARADFETLAGEAPLDDGALVDLAEACWRTGDIGLAGEAAVDGPRARGRGAAGAHHRGRGRLGTRPARRGTPARDPGDDGCRRDARRVVRRDAPVGRLADGPRRSGSGRRDVVRR